MANSNLTKYVVKEEDFDSNNFTSKSVTFYRQFNIVVCIYHLRTIQFNDTNNHTVMPTGKIPLAFRPAPNADESTSILYWDIVNYEGDIQHGIMGILSDGSMIIRLGTRNKFLNVYGSFSYIVED